MNYDPPRWSIQIVELVFNNRGVERKTTVKVGGNCRGESVISSAISEVDDEGEHNMRDLVSVRIVKVEEEPEKRRKA